MQKPNSFDDVKAGGDYTPIELGGHHATIMSVKEQMSRTNKNMVVVALDFAANDRQAGYFKNQFDNDTRDDKKWPYQAVQYIVTEDADGKCSKSFKGFITAFERSNDITTNWGDKFTEQFKGKKIGVVYGEVEEEYNGEIKTRRRIRWFCEDATVDSQKVPDKKLLPTTPANTPATNNSGDGFMNIPDGIEEELPFN
jgi:hypothetical protein